MEKLFDTGVFNDSFRKTRRKCQFLFVILVIYVLAGTLLFQFVEYDERVETVNSALEEIESERKQLLEVLWAETLAKGEEDWSEIANQKLDIYEKTLTKHVLNGIDLEQEGEDDNPWTFTGSLYYAYTVVTTIGYGNFCPTTTFGKLLTIIYATVGVPLNLVYLAEVGKLLTLILKALLRKRWPSDYDNSDDFNFHPILAILFTLGFMCFGAIIFTLIEDDWSLLDGAYFSFITGSTVGFGDLTPQTDVQIFLFIFYSITALSLCGMCFVVVQGSFEQWLNTKEQQVYWWWQKKRVPKAKKTDDATSDTSFISGFRQKLGKMMSVVAEKKEIEEEEEVPDVEIEEEDEEY